MTDDWTLVFDGWDPADEGRREALCTPGNGRSATRGAAPESRADGVRYPGTCAAGAAASCVAGPGSATREHGAATPGRPALRVHRRGPDPAHVAAAHLPGRRRVVVGSRRRGGFAGSVLGSVGNALLHRSPCPVAVVRLDDDVLA
ncbi:universal stress protein [Pseudonocardia abyssalis]|jgi:hypothetical protein|uniref:Universal stress protein n=1 Tax=Pseudonocardia abyssalis TaxID=2792008 RepID=A0ABS6UT43_9PSEU|nr:universal stress protein [Pseudonocardia abyssalis]MBW0113872.1 universal stress protein [Pseudonocardia abyssalis]MBW0135131.1 universal stress protein [Pseudonocardia abyssalis]